ncbi:uncharacterized protein CIMG_08191 [Coccidioides immitis RS]|uniref:Uncharacterized protein n=1 Tax=Coccidioides immitis (strain RS) TaxID=246410 RepID=J3K507_COCIM|nr:uncharacterized protein CIMG_08191 [Coccidioides immitis RS]EAS29445.3 hypothetical protein CIMG_08191 [Coccidioides immitis RS]
MRSQQDISDHGLHLGHSPDTIFMEAVVAEFSAGSNAQASGTGAILTEYGIDVLDLFLDVSTICHFINVRMKCEGRALKYAQGGLHNEAELVLGGEGYMKQSAKHCTSEREQCPALLKLRSGHRGNKEQCGSSLARVFAVLNKYFLVLNVIPPGLISKGLCSVLSRYHLSLEARIVEMMRTRHSMLVDSKPVGQVRLVLNMRAVERKFLY